MRSSILVFAVLLACTVAVPAQSHTSKVGKSKPVAQQKELPELTAVGALGASNLYTTFLAVGAIHDNFVSGTYDAATASNLLQSIRGLLGSSIEHLEAVQESSSVSSEDIEFLAAMVDTYMSLRREADSLLDYVETGTDADSGKFQKDREKAWEKIAKLLDLE